MKVAIIGRPNVGKSTLFNALTKSNEAITWREPHTTRDRIIKNVNLNGRNITLIDTGGFDPNNKDVMGYLVNIQVEKAIKEADIILFVVDAKTGPLEEDEIIAKKLINKIERVILVVNKVDSPAEDYFIFAKLGFKDIVPISAVHRKNLNALQNEILKKCELLGLSASCTTYVAGGDYLKVVISGRPNTGKSSLFNRIIGEERAIVSDISGTTRDSIDTLITYKNKQFILIDTAGLRKKSKITQSVEKFSTYRAIKSIEHADVVIHLLDPIEGFTTQDRNICSFITRSHKGLVIAINKYDLLEKIPDNKKKEYIQIIKEDAHPYNSPPVIFISALTGWNIHKLIEICFEINEKKKKHISSIHLSNTIRNIVSEHPPPLYKNKRPQIKGASMIIEEYPKINIKAIPPEGIKKLYIKFLLNKIREKYGLWGVPLEIKIT